jgi:hypothetical protein
MEPSNHHLHSHDNHPSPFLGSVKHGVSVHTDHGEQAEEVGFGQPNSVGHDKHAGYSVVMFRDRFWVCLALTVPTLIWEPMLQAWFGYRAPVFPGSGLFPAVFGTVVFFYGGWVFCRARCANWPIACWG